MVRLGMNGRSLPVAVAAVVLLLGGAEKARGADLTEPAPSPQIITRAVTWELPSGQTRTLALAATAAGNTFTATLDDGEKPQTVSGTVGANGAVSGTVRDGGGALVGTFSGASTLSGAFTLANGQAGGTWLAE